MECDVCGGTVNTDFLIDDVRGRGRRLACVLCFAESVELGGKPLMRFGYRPPNERWAAVICQRSDDQFEHGYGPFSKTLCGLYTGSDAERFRHHFTPNAEGSCDSCSIIAAEMDSLWPQGVRGRK